MKSTLKWLSKQTAYLEAPVNTGILMMGKEAVIVDTGLDRDHAGKILRGLEEENLMPVAVINTHSHADHCGGNAQLQKRLGLPVIAPRLEKPFIEDPYLESFGLYGGANPPAALQNKFLKAKPSVVHQSFEPEEKEIHFRSFSIELIPLPGHSPQQTGVLYDGILFSADVLLGKGYLDKHLIPFNSDVRLHRKSLFHLREIEVDCCVPSHGRPMSDMTELINCNEEALHLIDSWLLSHMAEPATLDELLSFFCREHQMDLETISQYHLYRTAFAAHLTALTESGRIRHAVSGSLLRWQAVL
ncbi:MAG: MBL fold metallo-hydrolase [Bacillota bacterium]|nr:MBL fold metallo-hydrolase [Bacillota bacterium]MDW7677096.1 MBL fold metallo-hydrolase [Bacillota bacterium]